MKKRIEELIPIALEILEDEFKDNAIPSEYNGYISAFGAGIIQSGLKPTIAIYENKNAKTKGEKDRLMGIILKIIAKYENVEINTNSLLRYVIENGNEAYLKELIKDSAIAVKLAMRTFELKKEN